MRRGDWLRRIRALDPERDCTGIYRIMTFHEFTWDMSQALSFALFRTFAVPSIGRLLAETGAFTEAPQKRYDDTVLILDAILEHGFDTPRGRAALRRMNAMHRAYAISNADFLYVLSTFVVVPIRWLQRFGWRQPSRHEIDASVHHYRRLARCMGMRAVPETYADFAALLDGYEREHFAFDSGARAVADATLALMTRFPPGHRLPARWVRWLAHGLFDDALCDALRYDRPGRLARAVSHGGLRLRARVVRWLPARRTPRYARELPNIRSYPEGYTIESLGTFPRGCPVSHAGDGRQPGP